jgi:hypothetical protein
VRKLRKDKRKIHRLVRKFHDDDVVYWYIGSEDWPRYGFLYW